MTHSQTPSLNTNLIALHKRVNAWGDGIYEISIAQQQYWKEHVPALKEFQIEGLIVKPDQQILFYENGSGRLLKLDSSGKLERIDRSIFGGERFGAEVFVFRDTLFSIGGYGFWQVNGALRYFEEKTREWSILRTNDHSSIANGVNGYYFFDKKAGKLYCIFREYPQEYLIQENQKKQDEQLLLQILDLRTKQWNKKPLVINSFIGREIADLRVIHKSNAGLFVQSKFHSQTFEMDFEQNALFEIDDEFVTQMGQLNKSIPFHLLFLSDSSISFFDLEKDSLAQLNTRTLRKQKKAVLYKEVDSYSDLGTQEQLILVLIILNLVTAVCFVIFYGKVKRRFRRSQKTTEEMVNHPVFLERKKMTHFINLLNDLELQIVNTLSKNHKAGKNTSIDEVNKLIGIDKRPYKIKNNIRAEVLKIINKKFMDFSNVTEELIERERSDFDKRYFEYKLNERYSNKLKQNISGGFPEADPESQQ